MNTSKTRTQKNRTHDERIAGLESNMAQIVGLLEKLSASPVSVPTPEKPARVGKASKPDKAKQAKREAHRARVEGITARKTAWAEFDIAHAVKLASAEVRANRKAGVPNARVQETSPTSLRVWLSSETNQALRSVRKREGVTYADCEAMLEKAVGKK